MKQKKRTGLTAAAGMLFAFAVWTALIRCADVRPIGPNGTEVGFASLNAWFHNLTGVDMTLYTATDWLGLVPIFACACFGVVGLVQWIRRRSILRVDADIILLGVYYIVVISAYLFFATVPINYRPILIDGISEASYPSSTVLLVLTVMPSLKYQADRRIKPVWVRKIITGFSAAFSFYMVLSRVISGVHWLTDIIGAVFLSAGLFMAYKYASDLLLEKRDSDRR